MTTPPNSKLNAIETGMRAYFATAVGLPFDNYNNTVEPGEDPLLLLRISSSQGDVQMISPEQWHTAKATFRVQLNLGDPALTDTALKDWANWIDDLVHQFNMALGVSGTYGSYALSNEGVPLQPVAPGWRFISTPIKGQQETDVVLAQGAAIGEYSFPFRKNYDY